MDNKNLFSYENKTKNKLKPFIIAFGVFVVILAVFSAIFRIEIMGTIKIKPLMKLLTP